MIQALLLERIGLKSCGSSHSCTCCKWRSGDCQRQAGAPLAHVNRAHLPKQWVLQVVVLLALLGRHIPRLAQVKPHWHHEQTGKAWCKFCSTHEAHTCGVAYCTSWSICMTHTEALESGIERFDQSIFHFDWPTSSTGLQCSNIPNLDRTLTDTCEPRRPHRFAFRASSIAQPQPI